MRADTDGRNRGHPRNRVGTDATRRACHGVSRRHEARKVREHTAAAVEEGIELMLAERDTDPNRSLVGRLLRSDN